MEPKDKPVKRSLNEVVDALWQIIARAIAAMDPKLKSSLFLSANMILALLLEHVTDDAYYTRHFPILTDLIPSNKRKVKDVVDRPGFEPGTPWNFGV